MSLFIFSLFSVVFCFYKCDSFLSCIFFVLFWFCNLFVQFSIIFCNILDYFGSLVVCCEVVIFFFGFVFVRGCGECI